MALITDTSILFSVLKLNTIVELFSSTNIVLEKSCIVRERMDNANNAFLKSVSIY